MPLPVPMEAGTSTWVRGLQRWPHYLRVIQQWHPWLWWPRLLPQTFPVVDLVLSFLQTVSLHPAAVPSLSLLSKPYIPAPNPTSASANTRLRLRPEGSGTYHLHRSYAVLPAIDGLPPSPLLGLENTVIEEGGFRKDRSGVLTVL